jgi:5'-nucleotidase (lipoprotein e(P4) family)
MGSRGACGIAAIALAALCATAGCKTARPAGPSAAEPRAQPTTPASTLESPQPDDLLNAVLWTQRAVEHDLVFREVYHAAELALVHALSDPTWDALPRGERDGACASLAPAVILDVDETVLDNAPYEAWLVKNGKQYDDFSWSQWCRREKARPLPGAVEFTRFAADHGVAIYFISNRTVDLGPATLANLKKVGFPIDSDSVFLGLGTVVPGCETVGSDKGCRRSVVAKDHRVLMQFGDSVGDFVDVASDTPEGRERAMEPYAAWIGERWWVLPNPIYGSWEPAVFNNN